jgi:hypothetical protein
MASFPQIEAYLARFLSRLTFRSRMASQLQASGIGIMYAKKIALGCPYFLGTYSTRLQERLRVYGLRPMVAGI